MIIALNWEFSQITLLPTGGSKLVRFSSIHCQRSRESSGCMWIPPLGGDARQSPPRQDSPGHPPRQIEDLTVKFIRERGGAAAPPRSRWLVGQDHGRGLSTCRG